MSGLSSQTEHLIWLQQDGINFPQNLRMLILMGMVSDRPDEGQAEILLIGIREFSLNAVHDEQDLHDVVIDLLQKGLDNGLQRLEILHF